MLAWTLKNVLWNLTPLVGLFFLMFVYILLCYRKPAQGQAIVRSGLGGIFVSFSGMIASPFLHKVEYMDITFKRIVIDRQGSDALICKDGIKIDVKAAFFVRVNPTTEDVKKVVQKLRVEQASDVETLYELFSDRFAEALKTVSKDYSYEELTHREMFKEKVILAVPADLDGYLLDTVTVDYLGKTKTA